MHVSKTIDNPQGYYVVKDVEPSDLGTRSLFISPTIFNDYKFLINEYSCDVLNIGPSYKGYLFDLCLSEIPNADRLVSFRPSSSGQAIKVKWEELSEFRSLIDLRIERMNPSFDFDYSRLELLNLAIEYDEKNTTWKKCNKLRSLWVQGLKTDDLTSLEGMDELEVLHLVKPSLKSLKGVNNLKKLKILSLGYAKKLDSLEYLNKSKNLKRINAEGNNKNVDWGVLAEMPQLEAVSIDAACDISFIEKLINLRHLAIWKSFPKNQKEIYDKINDDIVFNRKPIEDGAIFSIDFKKIKN